jgi:aryl-alcohol dehydrogenase-like predicted oxidoreductase
VSVEELAKKRNVKMAQIAIAWSIKRTTAPIFGTTKLENLKDMIGQWMISRKLAI